MALKDWKKTRDNGWTHKTQRTGDGYDYRGNLYPHREIIIIHRKQGWVVEQNGFFDMVRISPYFKTKSQALAYAKNYMRRHQ